MLSPELEAAIRRALDDATARGHEFSGLEHLLLSLLGPPIGGISERPAPKVSSRTPEQGLGPVTRI